MDKRKRNFSVDFPRFAIGPQDSAGNVSGSLNEFGGSFFGGPSCREHASFAARLAAWLKAGVTRVVWLGSSRSLPPWERLAPEHCVGASYSSALADLARP